MRRLRAFLFRLRGLIYAPARAQSSGDDFSAELASHLAMHVEDGMRAGLSAEEARRQALIKLGGVEQARQAYRERSTLPWVEGQLQDVRYGVRTLRRSPGFAIVAVGTLALGIGACTAVFSLVNAVLLRPLPYGDPRRLVYLFTPNPRFKAPAEIFGPSYGDFYDLKKQSHSFQSMTAFDQKTFNLASQGAVERVGAATVDGDFFQTLQASPVLGRAIGPDDDQPGRDRVVVIGYSLWQSMFAASADVLHRSLLLDENRYQIIGVMPAEFEYPHFSDLPYGQPEIKATQIWLPLALTPQRKADHDNLNGNAIARLRPGVSPVQAQAEMSAIMAHLNLLHNAEMRGWGAQVDSFMDNTMGPVRPLLWMLLSAVGLVLLIACGNAANLLLARAASRMRELGMRVALGAGRSRIIRQLLTESLLIGLTGGVIGVGLAFVFLRLLPRLDPGNIPRLNEASLDLRVLLFTVIVSVLTSMLAGILPALAVSRVNLTNFLAAGHGRGTAGSHSRVQGALIVAETALVVVLLSGAGLLIRSYINVESVDTGFSQSTVSMNIALDSHYRQLPLRQAFFSNLIGKVAALPGIRAVGAVSKLPLSNTEALTMFWVDGYPNERDQMAEWRFATPEYFSAMKIPLVGGRFFTNDDRPGNSPVAMVNQSFALKYFADRNPIGGQIGYSQHSRRTVVGVVGDVRHSSLEAVPQPQVYLPFTEGDARGASIVASSTLPPQPVAAAIRATLKTIDPNLAVADVHTMGELESEASARRRFQTTLLALFAGAALLLALAGIYGLMSYSVSRREREVGIRMALGAQRADVMLLVIRSAAGLMGLGLAAGLGCAWFTERTIKAFLFEVGAHDPMTLLIVCLLLAVCGLIAAIVPARRAASVDPMRALRAE
ncbi:MAG TPA: ABC transporter permease [Terracidiphilus sp.]|jgi:putative ABC transport system permease protein